MSFDELITECKGCTRCKLRQNAIQVVPGAGDSKAEIMFIGEAPGKQEDIQGIPFVGASGKFLNEMLSSIGLNRDNIYIANMVKCRPPENRDPDAEELLACSDWLSEQLRLINPKVVVTLGRFGMARFFGDKKISQIHGKVTIEGDKAYIALYHPAVALYNGSMRDVLSRDFKIIKKVLDMQKSGTLHNLLKDKNEDTIKDNDPFAHIHNEKGGITGEEKASATKNSSQNNEEKPTSLFD